MVITDSSELRNIGPGSHTITPGVYELGSDFVRIDGTGQDVTLRAEFGVAILSAGIRVENVRSLSLYQLSVLNNDPNSHRSRYSDCLSIDGNTVREVHLHYCALMWGVDEVLDIYRTRASGPPTKVWSLDCVFAEGEIHSSHPEGAREGGHSMGTLLGNTHIEAHFDNCLWASNYDRNPRLQGLVTATLHRCCAWNFQKGPTVVPTSEGQPSLRIIGGRGFDKIWEPKGPADVVRHPGPPPDFARMGPLVRPECVDRVVQEAATDAPVAIGLRSRALGSMVDRHRSVPSESPAQRIERLALEIQRLTKEI